MLKRLGICILLFSIITGLSAYSVAAPIEIIDLVGDKDQNPPPDADGNGIIHEPDDPAGFDLRQVGGTVSWTHDISDFLTDVTIHSARLDIAVVGLIDGNWGTIDNKLYIDGAEILGAFDNSNDGWILYSFDIAAEFLLDGYIDIQLAAHPYEGWGGPDYSELFVSGETPDPVPEPATMLLLGLGIAGFSGIRKKLNR